MFRKTISMPGFKGAGGPQLILMPFWDEIPHFFYLYFSDCLNILVGNTTAFTFRVGYKKKSH